VGTGAVSPRYATIDVGTNTVLLLVAERRGGTLVPVVERAEITRLGRGVDATGRLDPAAIEDTVAVLTAYAGEARYLGVEDPHIACVATSAARDAQNGADFFAAVRAAAGLTPEVIPGDEEARLVWLTAHQDFGGGGAKRPAPPGTPLAPGQPPPAAAALADPSVQPLAVLDVGGGSTEFIVGEGAAPRARTSLQVGAVRLTERHVHQHPIPPEELEALRQGARQALEPLGALAPSPGARLVGVAGTVTTLCAVAQALPRYDGRKVHGKTLGRAQIEELIDRMARLTVPARAALPGMEPKRADVIVGGAMVVVEAMRRAGFEELTVSDRGVRWGLLYDRFPA
jgi:exopolyphosphatase/guanosine-5'-triphosphate,3'-diphosphate pyrophosphatase